MVHARTRFLEGNYYDFMRQAVCDRIRKYEIHSLIDAGCGQGYYTKQFSMYADAVTGIDLSKEAIRHAVKKDRKTQYVVASIFSMPVMDASVDGVTSVFVPSSDDEVYRVLKEHGYWIVVKPGPKHCWELKEILYEHPYENKKENKISDGFEWIKQDIICERKQVDDVWSLLEMTPYRYKSPEDGVQRVQGLDTLEVTFEFIVTVWRKNENKDKKVGN